MKNYNVKYELHGQIVGDFNISARDIKHAKKIAQIDKHYRLEIDYQFVKEVRTHVKRLHE